MKNDHRSKFSNLSNWKEEAWKNQGFNGIRTRDLRDTGAMLYQLSYEATHSSLWSTTAVQIYELFHIYFSSFHSSRENELNKLTSLPVCGFIAQLVEHRTGIVEVTGSNPVEALIFFLLLSNCLNWKIFRWSSSLWSTTVPQFKYMNYFIYTSHQILLWLMPDDFTRQRETPWEWKGWRC